MFSKYLLLLVLTFSTSFLTAQAENYGRFEWDLIQIGYASPVGDGFDGGFALGTEVRYNITDDLSAGLNFEIAGFWDDLGNNLVRIGSAATYNVTGDYYFVSQGSVRPFVGASAGVYGSGQIVTTVNSDIDDDDISVASTLGVGPRVGIELGHLRVALEYNHTFSGRVFNYVGFTVAPTLFGGPRNRRL